MNRKGFAPIFLAIAVVILLAVAGGIWYWTSHKSSTNKPQSQSAAMVQTPSTYQNTDYGVSFDYPNTWTVKSGDTAEGDYGLYTQYGPQYTPTAVSLVTVEIPPSLYPGTNLEGAYLNLSVNKQLSQSQCLALIPPLGSNNTPDKVIAIDGVTFTRYAAAGAAAGTYEFTENYSGYINGTCYEFNLGDTTGNDVSASGTRMSGSANDISDLEEVLSSVKFTGSTSTSEPVSAANSFLVLNLPTTSTLAVLPGDKYGLLMAPASDLSGFGNFGPEYDDDGVIAAGPYVGYHRLIMSICGGVRDCVGLLLATKDYQSFILDNYINTQDRINSVGYLNTKKISSQGFIPLNNPTTSIEGYLY